MSITPAKIGEVLKPYLVQQITGDSIAKTIPVILTERLLDFLALVLIAIFSLFFVKYSSVSLFITGFLLFLLILLPGNKWFSEFLFRIFEKLPFIQNYMAKIREAHNSIQKMIKPKPLSLMIMLSTISWFFECFALFLVLGVFSHELTVLWSAFIYAFSTIAGAVSILPGGLGVTEGSLTYLIGDAGIPSDIAILSTFIIRVVTLWFAVLIGAISLLILQKRIGRIDLVKT